MLALAFLTSPAARADDPPAAAPADPSPAAPPANPAATPAATPTPPPPAAATPTAPADGIAPADAAAASAPSAKSNPPPGGDRAYVDTAVEFLKALAHCSRKGDQGAAAWDTLKQLGGDKISVTIAGVHHDFDTAAKSADAKLLQFSKISSWRDGSDIKGVQVELLDFKIGADDHKGKGKVAMAEAAGTWTVTSVDVE